jgi:hypothetical protein
MRPQAATPRQGKFMAEEKKEPWLNYLALTTVILAVCATLSTFKGGGYSTRSVMSQSQASDEWAYFQAKAVKGDLYQLQIEKLEIERRALPKSAPMDLTAGYDEKIGEYRKKVEKYETEKSEIQKKARELESIRDESQIHSRAFGVAVIYLQIAILLSSIAGLLKRKPVWYLGMATGVVGLAYFANGFLLFLA